MIIGVYLILIFFYFDLIISYHVQLYFLTLVLILLKLFTAKSQSVPFFIFFILIFWGISINYTILTIDDYFTYFFIINGCLDYIII